MNYALQINVLTFQHNKIIIENFIYYVDVMPISVMHVAIDGNIIHLIESFEAQPMVLNDLTPITNG